MPDGTFPEFYRFISHNHPSKSPKESVKAKLGQKLHDWPFCFVNLGFVPRV